MLDLNKGDKVILKGFTGVKLGVFEVKSTTKKTITVLKRNGDEMIFDRKTGKQVNVEEGKERYANSIMEDDGSFVAPSTAGAKRKKAKKADTKAKKAAASDEDEDDEEDEPIPVKKSKKSSKPAKAAKKSKKHVDDDEDEDDEDDDEFEEVDD